MKYQIELEEQLWQTASTEQLRAELRILTHIHDPTPRENARWRAIKNLLERKQKR
jgi:hypothetical protein